MVTLLVLAVAPSLALLIYLYARDQYEREPPQLVLQTFFTGMLAVVPVLILDLVLAKPLGAYLLGDGDTFTNRVWEAFIVAALVEELCKLGAVLGTAYRSPHLNEPYDAVLYAAAAALGFATVENILYVVQHGVQVGILRALLAVPGHALFGIIMGYYLGLARFSVQPERRRRNMVMAWLVPTLFHGLYDVLAMNAEYAIFAFLILPLVLYMWIRGLRTIKSTLAASPFAPMRRTALFAGPCRDCGTPVLEGARFCHECGVAGPMARAQPVTGG